MANETPKLIWSLKQGTKDTIYASGSNIDGIPERRFSFKLVRYKNKDTRKTFYSILV